jgi:hypothetical protein
VNAGTWAQGAGTAADAAPRLFDAAGAEDCVDVLVNRRCSLLLCSDDGPLLDRQAQMLMRTLRDVADIETAVLLEMDRGLLLDRFNRLLGEFTLEQARQRVPTVVRVWILHVHSAAETAQARLLLRLCQDFPAAGVVLALLGPVSAGRELAPEGSTRRLQVRVLTDFWSEMSRAAGPSARTDPPLGPSPEEPAPAAAPPAAAPPAPPARHRFAGRAPWIGLGLLVACAGAVVWVQSRAGLDLLRGAPQGARADAVAAVPAAAPVAAAAAADPARQVLPSPVPPAAPAMEGAADTQPAAAAPGGGVPGRAGEPAAAPAPAGAIGAVAVAAVAPAATLVSAPMAPAPAAASAPATSDRPGEPAGKALPPPPPPPAAPSSTPGDQLASSVRWVQAQPPSGWLVQHGIDSDVGRLLELRRNFPRLSESRVLALVRADGRLYYALVSGPFDSADGARNFIKDGTVIPSLPWVRSIASLARELDERRASVRATAAVN